MDTQTHTGRDAHTTPSPLKAVDDYVSPNNSQSQNPNETVEGQWRSRVRVSSKLKSSSIAVWGEDLRVEK